MHLKKPKAFTLVETAIIIVIIGILAAVSAATINLGDTLQIRVRTAARQIQSHIRYAQKIAMVTRTRTGILFLTTLDVGLPFGPNNYQGLVEVSSDQELPLGLSMAYLLDPLTNKDMQVRFSDFETSQALSHFRGVEITRTGFSPADGAGQVLWFLVFEPNGRPYSLRWWGATPGLEELEADSFVRLNNIVDVTVDPITGFVSIRETP